MSWVDLWRRSYAAYSQWHGKAGVTEVIWPPKMLGVNIVFWPPLFSLPLFHVAYIYGSGNKLWRCSEMWHNLGDLGIAGNVGRLQAVASCKLSLKNDWNIKSRKIWPPLVENIFPHSCIQPPFFFICQNNFWQKKFIKNLWIFTQQDAGKSSWSQPDQADYTI